MRKRPLDTESKIGGGDIEKAERPTVEVGVPVLWILGDDCTLRMLPCRTCRGEGELAIRAGLVLVME